MGDSQTPSTWRDGCAQRTICRNDATPEDVVQTCMDWYDGLRSAMLRFSSGKAVKPEALLREARKALVENNQGEPETTRLQRLVGWVEAQRRLCKAVQAFRKARFELHAATQALALSPYDLERIEKAAASEDAAAEHAHGCAKKKL